MFIDDCVDCNIIVGPCDGSIFIRTSKNCSISVISKQLRFRDCENLKIYTYSASDPVIEASKEIYFGPYNAFFPNLTELFKKANFVEGENKFNNIYDFSQAKSNSEINWGFMKKEDFVLEEIPIGDDNTIYEGLYDNYRYEIKDFIPEKEKVEFKEITNFFDNITNKNNNNNNLQNDFVMINNNQEIHAEPVIESQPHNQFQNLDFVNDIIIINDDTNNNSPVFIEKNEILPSSNSRDFFMVSSYDIEDEETKALKERQREHEERIKKIVKKQEEELIKKQEYRNKANDFLNSFYM